MIGVWGPAQMLDETSRTRRSAAVADDDGATVAPGVGATTGGAFVAGAAVAIGPALTGVSASRPLTAAVIGAGSVPNG